jgi:hypothetical protein
MAYGMSQQTFAFETAGRVQRTTLPALAAERDAAAWTTDAHRPMSIGQAKGGAWESVKRFWRGLSGSRRIPIREGRRYPSKLRAAQEHQMTSASNEDRRSPLREDGAERIMAAVTDPITRNLMTIALAAARMRFMRAANLSQAEWEARLPLAPFDLEFFASVLEQVFSKHEIIERVLRGESVPSASGWDF